MTLSSGALGLVEVSGVISGSGDVVAKGYNYDQLRVRGVCNLSGITLNAALEFPSAPGDQFTIINATPDDPPQETFNGLPEGAVFSISGEPFNSSYAGGGGSGVVLTHVSALAAPASIWTNSLGGNWNDPANWNNHAVPNASNATITNNGIYAITNNANAAISQFVYANPFCTLAGSGNLFLSGPFLWQAGSLSGPGTITAQGGMFQALPELMCRSTTAPMSRCSRASSTWRVGRRRPAMSLWPPARDSIWVGAA